MAEKKLEGLAPEKVFEFFEEIAGIPHGSGHIDKISEYLVSFAKERGLACVQDSLKNVIISKPATAGYEEEKPVILQGHMDMVAVKEEGCGLDLLRDGLDITHDAAYVWANGTSLGADDGIAIAYALAVLDSDATAHPPLQAVFTVNEETGMDGAIGLDASLLKGRRMLNIDSEQEGILTAGCAGGTKLECCLPVLTAKKNGMLLHLEVKGLLGGHSGMQIGLGRANACILLARLLHLLWKELRAEGIEYYLAKLEGGEKSNAIPNFAMAELVVSKRHGISDEDRQKLLDRIKSWEAEIRHEYAGKENEIRMEVRLEKEEDRRCIDAASTSSCIRMLLMQPDGVISRNAYLDSLVETSLNMGIMRLGTEEGRAAFRTTYEIRSNMPSGMQLLTDKVQMIAESLGAGCTVLGRYPHWEFRKDSPLQQKMVRVYERLYGKAPVIDVVHAGLECGVFASKMEGLDAVSFGPDILDIHTTKEKLDIASAARVWEFLLAVLAEKE